MSRVSDHHAPFTGPFPWGFATLLLAFVMWIASEPQVYGVHDDRTTVRAETFAPVRAHKEGLIPPHLLEDAIEARLRERPAKFKRGN